MLYLIALIAVAAAGLNADDNSNILQKTAITGTVAVKKDASGKTVSVTVSNDKKSFTIEPSVVKLKISGGSTKTYKITEEDLQALADFDTQTVRIAVKCLNGKPIDVSKPTAAN